MNDEIKMQLIAGVIVLIVVVGVVAVAFHEGPADKAHRTYIDQWRDAQLSMLNASAEAERERADYFRRGGTPTPATAPSLSVVPKQPPPA